MSTKKEKWNFENLICKLPHCRCMQQFPCSNHHYSDECFSTNDHSKSESIEWKEALYSFIKKWVPGSYAHLSDNDENDGERLRTAIQDAITAAVEAREREISEAIKKMKTYTGGSSVEEKHKRVNKQEVLSIINK